MKMSTRNTPHPFLPCPAFICWNRSFIIYGTELQLKCFYSSYATALAACRTFYPFMDTFNVVEQPWNKFVSVINDIADRNCPSMTGLSRSSSWYQETAMSWVLKTFSCQKIEAGALPLPLQCADCRDSFKILLPENFTISAIIHLMLLNSNI